MVIGYSAAKLVNISETTKQKQFYFPVLSEILWFDNRIVVVMLTRRGMTDHHGPAAGEDVWRLQTILLEAPSISGYFYK